MKIVQISFQIQKMKQQICKSQSLYRMLDSLYQERSGEIVPNTKIARMAAPTFLRIHNKNGLLP